MQFKEAIDQFSDWRKFKVKKQTVKGYDQTLRQFCLFLRNPQIEDISIHHVMEFLNGMKELINLKDKMELILKNFAPKIKEKNLELIRNNTPHQRKRGAGQAPSNFTILSDAKMVQIIFENLISNAIKYTPSGGQIHVKMQKKGNEILIGVVDTGIGIPADQQLKIFTKFFRADNATSYKADGTGLGLYIVKTIVEKIGGKIWFRSPVVAGAKSKKERHKGTAFYVAFYKNNILCGA